MAILKQVICSALIFNLCICLGIMFAWPSSTLRLFESKDTTLHRPMTEMELSLFGSLSSLGGLIGTPALGYLLDRIGRKNCSIIASTLGVLSWTLIAASSRVEVILVAMFITGMSGAVLLVVTVFVSEICQESIRGGMCAGSMIFYSLGMLISYLVGGLLEYNVMIYISLSLSVAVTASLMMLKETPIFYMAKGMEEEAAESMAFYRSLPTDSKQVLEELNIIRRSLNPEMEDLTPEEEKLNDLMKNPAQTKQKLSMYQFIKKSKSTQRALCLTLTLVTASIFQGLVVVQVYAEPLFEEAIPSMSPTLGSTIMAVVVVLAGFVAAYLTESLGRRPLMIFASFATATCCLILGLQLHLKLGPGWLVAVVMYLFTTVFSCGAGTIPFVLIAEVFLPEIKSFASMLAIEWTWICNYIILFIFNPLVRAIGLGPVFYIFSGVSVLTGVYCFFMLPETKGLAVDEIQNKLYTRKSKKMDLY